MTEPQAASTFTWGEWILGFILAFAAGSVGNAIVIAIGFRINVTIVSAILGIVPGLLLVFVGLRAGRRGLAMGMVVAGSLIALLGGICGAIGTSTQVKG
jgi:hypothetical protein